MPIDHVCCDDIIEAKADIRSLSQTATQSRSDAQIWRDAHNTSNNETFERFGTSITRNREEIDALRTDINKRFDSIEEKLSSRVQPWVTIAFTCFGTIVGALVAIVIAFVNHFI